MEILPPPPPPLPSASTTRGAAVAPKPGLPVWARVGLVLAAGFVLMCGFGLAAVVYLGARAPDTKVYSGREIPARFVSDLQAKAPLEQGETILFFYSPALLDVGGAFSFVSDRRVVVHDAERAHATTSLSFDRIDSASLASSSSWLEDGTLTLGLPGGEELAFPVSSEGGRDQKFLAAVQDGLARARRTGAPPAEKPETAPQPQ